MFFLMFLIFRLLEKDVIHLNSDFFCPIVYHLFQFTNFVLQLIEIVQECIIVCTYHWEPIYHLIIINSNHPISSFFILSDIQYSKPVYSVESFRVKMCM